MRHGRARGASRQSESETGWLPVCGEPQPPYVALSLSGGTGVSFNHARVVEGNLEGSF